MSRWWIENAHDLLITTTLILLLSNICIWIIWPGHWWRISRSIQHGFGLDNKEYLLDRFGIPPDWRCFGWWPVSRSADHRKYHQPVVDSAGSSSRVCIDVCRVYCSLVPLSKLQWLFYWRYAWRVCVSSDRANASSVGDNTMRAKNAPFYFFFNFYNSKTLSFMTILGTRILQ